MSEKINTPIRTLIEDYSRRLRNVVQAIDELDSEQVGFSETEVRLKTKASCYRTFIAELKRELDVEKMHIVESYDYADRQHKHPCGLDYIENGEHYFNEHFNYPVKFLDYIVLNTGQVVQYLGFDGDMMEVSGEENVVFKHPFDGFHRMASKQEIRTFVRKHYTDPNLYEESSK